MASFHAALIRHATYYESELRRAKELYAVGNEHIQQGLAIFDLEWLNIRAGQAWAASNSVSDKIATQLCSDYSLAGAQLLYIRIHPIEQMRWLQSALTAARYLDH